MNNGNIVPPTAHETQPIIVSEFFKSVTSDDVLQNIVSDINNEATLVVEDQDNI